MILRVLLILKFLQHLNSFHVQRQLWLSAGLTLILFVTSAMFNPTRPPGTMRISTHTIHQSETEQIRPNTNLHHAIQSAPTFSVGRISGVSRETKSREGTPPPSATSLPRTIGDSETQAPATAVSFTSSSDRTLSGPWAGLMVTSSHLPDTTSSHATGPRRAPSEILSSQRVIIPTGQVNQSEKQSGKQTTATALPQDINPIKTLSHALLPVEPDPSVIHLNSQSRISHTDPSISPSIQLSIIAQTLNLAPDGTRAPASLDLQLARWVRFRPPSRPHKIVTDLLVSPSQITLHFGVRCPRGSRKRDQQAIQ